ncbi:unnamed protein product [Rotaria magnacalcarata]|uniref:Glycosyltransferase family 1 protein n=1 Tax=Rotaria magnacalcarata TaxID=392030 RepID=A0A815XWQ3_9BILA|nr:unnamed protein product [Rotaria magnacalcarata]CAF1562715.1 unnamed protein product [Rotaria magnacalcarata]CAF2265098.1 unnamed protein product [Rotaria magnacalcarata]CAF3901063.1 unnamed protein product [Rotaria magnacalcarata]CAF4027374.1 unnamed protein product [Rotaria magnacalcarata]
MRLRISRVKFQHLFHLATLVVVTFIVFRATSDLDVRLQNGASSSDCPFIRMAIINSVFYHAEVWYSYMYAATKCQWHVSLFTRVLPFNKNRDSSFANITSSWSRVLLSVAERHVGELLTSTTEICSHEIIFIGTLNISYLKRLLHVLSQECDRLKTYLVLIQLHEANRDLQQLNNTFKNLRFALNSTRIEVRLLALGLHVKKYAEIHIKERLQVDLWIPVFPLDLPVSDNTHDARGDLEFTVQGSLDPTRRDYKTFVNDIKRWADVLRQHRVIFNVIGQARILSVYKYLHSPHIRLLSKTHYIPASDYYGLIHKSIGMIPIFVNEHYYENTQSSTIGCSILTRTPMFASRRLLDTNGYLTEEAVWLKEENESDVEAVIQILSKYPSHDEFQEALYDKRKQLALLAESSYEKNRQTLFDYANELNIRKNRLMS